MCGDFQTDLTCPSWVARTDGWQWRMFGCTLWAIITGLSAWRQLGLLQNWGAHSFWKNYFDKATSRFGYTEIPGIDPDRLPLYPGESDILPMTPRPPRNMTPRT